MLKIHRCLQRKVRELGGAGGFWGDQTMAPIQLLEEGDLQYLTMDYLSEVTMSIMHKQLKRNKKAGWATDLQDWLIAGGITLLHSSGVKLVTNAGGAKILFHVLQWCSQPQPKSDGMIVKLHWY